MLYAIIGLLVIIADQWTKFWVSGRVPVETMGEPFIPGVVSFANVHNDGCAFSFLSGSNARIYFIILTGVFTLFVIIALATKLISGKVSRWAIVLVTAGGLSNCIDRVIYGYVQDIFKLEFINFPVFNLADVFITVFAIIFALAIIFGKTRKMLTNMPTNSWIMRTKTRKKRKQPRLPFPAGNSASWRKPLPGSGRLRRKRKKMSLL